MKKIALFSLIVIFGVAGKGFVAVADEKPACDGNVCAIFPDGGDVEQRRCLKDLNAQNFSDKWQAEGASCDAANARVGRCFKQKNRARQDVMSCAAKICSDDSALWLYKKSDNKYQSYGVCYKKDWLQKKYCDKGSDRCKDCNGKCELNVFKWENGSFGKTDAYYDDKLCVCVAGGNGDNSGNTPVVPGVNPDPGEGDCTLILNVEVTCPDGFRYTKGEKVKLKKSENGGLICPDDEVIKINSVKDLEKYMSKICEGHNNLAGNSGGGVSGYDEMAVARKTLVEFFKNTEKNRNVWRDEDGNFNTARLASDLTAGVVLGTVGGVVSGVVIKKKQVEKGFDALHCTVGGQNVADWGDTFNVGLR